MVVIIPISEEEKMSILAGLRSRVPATKLVALKKVAEIADVRPESLQYMEMIDKRGIQEIIQSIEKIFEFEQDEVLKREALITLQKVKKALGTKFTIEIPKCKKCDEVIDLGWNYCTNCGSNIDSMEFENFKRCNNCNRYILDEWVYCAHCGVQLKEIKEKIPVCPKCRRQIDPTWMVCPYCGHRLRKIK